MQTIILHFILAVLRPYNALILLRPAGLDISIAFGDESLKP